MYFFFVFWSSKKNVFSDSKKCVFDQFNNWVLKELTQTASKKNVSFVGNGFIGIDVVIDKQLLISSLNAHTIKTPIFTNFNPLVELSIVKNKNFYFISDFNQGVSKGIYCYVVLEKCLCIFQKIYAHRTRPNLLVQEIRVSNPSTTSIKFYLKREKNLSWNQTNIKNLPIYYKLFEKSIVAITCTPVSTLMIIVKPQTEETFRFLCIVEQDAKPLNKNVSIISQNIIKQLSVNFINLKSFDFNDLDIEHFEAWRKLNLASFNISYSKAPNALNADKINLTRYALLSVVRAPLYELSEKHVAKKKNIETALTKNELCYSGHSTLLMPSKLWYNWIDIKTLLQTMEIWLMTLDHNGCVYLTEAGAHGIVQAFLLSLLAATFTHHRLESNLNPESDLHRQMHVNNLRVESLYLSLHFELDKHNKPYCQIHTTGRLDDTDLQNKINPINDNLWACTAGCLETPQRIGQNFIRFAIKMTKPSTPILFIAESKKHLEEIKKTLHVAEVLDVPEPESHKIDLHKHGLSNQSFLTSFWVFFIFIIIAFHAFLLKMIWTEWQNSNTIPYSRKNKRFFK